MHKGALHLPALSPVEGKGVIAWECLSLHLLGKIQGRGLCVLTLSRVRGVLHGGAVITQSGATAPTVHARAACPKPGDQAPRKCVVGGEGPKKWCQDLASTSHI